MRRRVTAAVLLCVCLVSRGGRELEEVELIQALGVDVSNESSHPGALELTAAGDGEEPELYHGTGEDVMEAQEALRWAGDRRLELTHVTQLVMGREVDLAQVLEQEVAHRKSGYGAKVWLSAGPRAGELLAGGKNPAGRLKSLEENGGVDAPTALEALVQLSREGEVRLPVLAEEAGELVFAGYETRGGTAE